MTFLIRFNRFIVALCGYTNAGKSSLLNALTQTAEVFASDMLFATLDPTTRLVRMPGMQFPDVLLTDTVGFIQKLPTNLVAAFRATLEEIAEADVLLHVVDVTNESWRKQECAVLQELAAMGLQNKPVVRVWNKIDLMEDQKEYWKYEAAKSAGTVAVSSLTGEGMKDLATALQRAVCSTMEDIACVIPYSETSILSTLHNLGSLSEVLYNDEGIFVRGKLPSFLVAQVAQMTAQAWKSQQQQTEDEAADTYFYESEMSVIDEQLRKADRTDEEVLFEEEREYLRKSSGVSSASGSVNPDDEMFDWTDLAKGRHSAVNNLTSPRTVFTSASFSAKTSLSNKSKVSVTQPSSASPATAQPMSMRERGNSKTLVRNSIREFEREKARAAQQQALVPSEQQRQQQAEAEKAELERQGLCADGLLDFDSGDFGHHADA